MVTWPKIDQWQATTISKIAFWPESMLLRFAAAAGAPPAGGGGAAGGAGGGAQQGL